MSAFRRRRHRWMSRGDPSRRITRSTPWRSGWIRNIASRCASVSRATGSRVTMHWPNSGSLPTARRVFEELKTRHQGFQEQPPDKEKEKRLALQSEALRRLFSPVSDRPHMDALAREWLSHNLRGVRHLSKKTLDEILDAGDRAFNLRVADPYLRYQMQGQGFTWSFFTHKDKQDCHVHGARPIVEIYGILEGEMESLVQAATTSGGTSAWCHRVLRAGDWLEVDALQCHIVHWLTEGKGVVFKAGPGPLAEVGKLGVKGKTPCTECPCMKPARVKTLESLQT